MADQSSVSVEMDRIEIATLEDMPFILELSGTEYAAPYNTEAFWRWRYFDNPIAQVKVYVARNVVGQIVAMQPVSTYTMLVGSTALGAHLLTGAMTHRDYRRRGLFRRLVERILADYRQSSDVFAYTFPNDHSVQGFRRFEGWEQREVLALYVRFMASAWLPTQQNKLHTAPSADLKPVPIGALTIREAECFDGETCTLVHSAFANSVASIQRNREYLQWRYCENPAAQYTIYQAYRMDELVGYLVLKATRLYGFDSGLIVDLVAENLEIARSLIAYAVSAAKRARLQIVAYLVGKCNPYRSVLLSEKFLSVPQGIVPKHFYLYTFANNDAIRTVPWYVTWGDIDVV